MSVSYGSKRLVVGAHYGLRDWIVQRATAVLMVLYTLLLLARILFTSGPLSYESWAAIFAPQWVKFFTYAVVIALIWHVWVGVRDILMDYVHATWQRLTLQVAALIWLAGCAGWAFQVIWSI